MSFNYQSEYNKFIAEWRKTFNFYQENGMGIFEILEMFKFDKERFKRDRIYGIHNNYFPELENDEDEAAALYRDCPNFVSTIDDALKQDQGNWIEMISNPSLVDKLKSLSEKDLELVNLVFIEGLKHREVAQQQGCSRVVITKKIKKIKKYLA